MAQLTLTRYQLLQAIVKTYSLGTANRKAIELEQSILTCGNNTVLDEYAYQLRFNDFLDDQLIEAFNASFLPFPDKFPKYCELVSPKPADSAADFGEAYKKNRIKTLLNDGTLTRDNDGKLVKAESKPKQHQPKQSYIGLSNSLQDQFKQIGFILGNTGNLEVGEYASEVLSLLWDDDRVIFPDYYKTVGYLEPITIFQKPQSEKVYLHTSVQNWADLDIDLAKKLQSFAKNVSGGYRIPRVKAQSEWENPNDLENETPLFELAGERYFQTYAMRTTYGSHPVEQKQAGKVVKFGFKTNIKTPLLMPLLGNDGLIWENIVTLTFPKAFNVKRLTPQSVYGDRRNTPRKTSVKTKISWGTKFIPTVENNPDVALSGSITLPGRYDVYQLNQANGKNSKIKSVDKLVISPNGKIELYSSGIKVCLLGHYNVKDPSESYWVENLPHSWVTGSARDGGSPLDRAMANLIDSTSKRVSSIKSNLVADSVIQAEAIKITSHKTASYSKRQWLRLKQSARKWALNLTDDQINKLPLNVSRSILVLKDKTSAKSSVETANRNIVSYYQVMTEKTHNKV